MSMDEFIDQRIAAHAATRSARQQSIEDALTVAPQLAEWQKERAHEFDEMASAVYKILEQSHVEPIVRGIFDYITQHNAYRGGEINFYTDVTVTPRITIFNRLNKAINDIELPKPHVEKRYPRPLRPGNVVRPAELTITSIEEKLRKRHEEDKEPFIEASKARYMRDIRERDWTDEHRLDLGRYLEAPNFWEASVIWVNYTYVKYYVSGRDHQGTGSGTYTGLSERDEGFSVQVAPNGITIRQSPFSYDNFFLPGGFMFNVELIKRLVTDAYLGKLGDPRSFQFEDYNTNY